MGKNWPTLSFVYARFPRLLQARCAWMFRWGQKADTKDFTTLGQSASPSQTGAAHHGCPQLFLTIPNSLWMKWLTGALPEPQPCNYPQPDSQLSSRLFIP